jgi:hypothetical protein
VAIAVIVVVAVFFLGMGIYALAAPAALVRPFGITLGESTSRSEVRAVYGGFGLAAGWCRRSSTGARRSIRTGSIAWWSYWQQQH